MKRINFLIVIVLMLGLLLSCQKAETPLETTKMMNSNAEIMAKGDKGDGCTTIQSGELFASSGDVITPATMNGATTTRLTCLTVFIAMPTRMQAGVSPIKKTSWR